MNKHVLMHGEDLPEACELRKRYEEGKGEWYDITECFYCHNFRGIESKYPGEKANFLLCFEVNPPKEEPSLPGGRIAIVVE